MARAFDENERAIIRRRLIESGQDLFGRYGLQRTRVEEISREAGISKGSFYTFFESKEVLFFTIIEDIQTQQRERMNQIATSGDGTAADRMERVMHLGLDMLDSYPVLRVMMQKEEFAQLLRRIPRDRIEAEYHSDEKALRRMVVESGGELTADPQIATGLVRAVFFVAMHAKEIAPGSEQALMDAFVHLMSHALFAAKERS